MLLMCRVSSSRVSNTSFCPTLINGRDTRNKFNVPESDNKKSLSEQKSVQSSSRQLLPKTVLVSSEKDGSLNTVGNSEEICGKMSAGML